jgi:YHS domain-containing protein
MIRLLIVLVLIFLLYLILRGLLTSDGGKKGGERGGSIDELVQDPVCKTYIPLKEAHRKVIGGKEVFFCSKTCANKFKDEEG